jgi:hypothetical protein
MGLRCLLGHEYANREVEREREERGDEVVVTYRTVETCDRCGERRIVSENKEVRPVQRPTGEAVATGLGGDGVTPDLGEGGDDAGSAADDDPAEDVSDLPGGDEPAVDDDEDHAAEDEDADEESVDDAIILDDDGEDANDDRDHGEWPAADDPSSAPDTDAAEAVDSAEEIESADGTTVVDADDDWPEPEGEDEGFDAEPSGSDPPAVSVGGAADDGGEAANGTATGKQFVSAEQVEHVNDARSGGETEFFCPNCGYARAAGGSSMRAGDICPDCHEGYIGERER